MSAEKYTLQWYQEQQRIEIAMCPLCGTGPRFDVCKNKLEHICKTPNPRGYWYAYGSQHMTMRRWNEHCELLAKNLAREEKQ